ncbi:1-phosphofructokinase [Agarivorans sp. B2Z047]|uniref:1-phosphofructokinase n=1 Tax=Agarivorans sp. B2Z047 TaxID=2652721 RepID=UPI00128D9AFE|nr:1-phosphofructokinase [Agarivorans sp. B2Z047]MPW30925.1 1-phosphofructokinase [Agarivorans sp. B2Z047]UQN40847.1 1-phosphofructokinase [Agarivorans sp. B2Z047]
MIYTLTLNPAADLELQIDEFAFDSVSRANHSRLDCGGKGFNVSRMLKNLGVTSTAMGFIGGFTGQRLASELSKMDIKSQFTQIAGETRTNVTVVEAGNKRHIKVNEAGPEVSPEELKSLVDQVKQNLHAGDWWVLGGSLLKGVRANFYAELITLIENAGAHAVLDTSGEALREGILAQPSLVKPNLDEAQELLGLSSEELKQTQGWTQALLAMGPKNLVVSLGKKGALMANEQQCAEFTSPSIVEANPIGAGDSMVAGLVWRLSLGESLAQALPYGLACGAASASRQGTDLGSLDQVEQLRKEIN